MTQDLMNQESVATPPDMGAMSSGQDARPHADLSTIKDSAIDRLAAEREKITESLRSFTTELRDMQSASPQEGLATSLVGQAADRAEQLIDYVEQRDPQQLLSEARSYAQSHPGMFLLGALVTGGVLGRATRSAAAGATSSTPNPTASSASTNGSAGEAQAFAPTPTAVDLR
ncbi:MAG: hypothetical protein ACJ73J_02080 [Actinomycetes bacterium]